MTSVTATTATSSAPNTNMGAQKKMTAALTRKQHLIRDKWSRYYNMYDSSAIDTTVRYDVVQQQQFTKREVSQQSTTTSVCITSSMEIPMDTPTFLHAPQRRNKKQTSRTTTTNPQIENDSSPECSHRDSVCDQPPNLQGKMEGTDDGDATQQSSRLPVFGTKESITAATSSSDDNHQNTNTKMDRSFHRLSLTVTSLLLRQHQRRKQEQLYQIESQMEIYASTQKKKKKKLGDIISTATATATTTTTAQKRSLVPSSSTSPQQEQNPPQSQLQEDVPHTPETNKGIVTVTILATPVPGEEELATPETTKGIVNVTILATPVPAEKNTRRTRRIKKSLGEHPTNKDSKVPQKKSTPIKKRSFGEGTGSIDIQRLKYTDVLDDKVRQSKSTTDDTTALPTPLPRKKLNCPSTCNGTKNDDKVKMSVVLKKKKKKPSIDVTSNEKQNATDDFDAELQLTALRTCNKKKCSKIGGSCGKQSICSDVDDTIMQSKVDIDDSVVQFLLPNGSSNDGPTTGIRTTESIDANLDITVEVIDTDNDETVTTQLGTSDRSDIDQCVADAILKYNSQVKNQKKRRDKDNARRKGSDGKANSRSYVSTSNVDWSKATTCTSVDESAHRCINGNFSISTPALIDIAPKISSHTHNTVKTVQQLQSQQEETSKDSPFTAHQWSQEVQTNGSPASNPSNIDQENCVDIPQQNYYFNTGIHNEHKAVFQLWEHHQEQQRRQQRLLQEQQTLLQEQQLLDEQQLHERQKLEQEQRKLEQQEKERLLEQQQEHRQRVRQQREQRARERHQRARARAREQETIRKREQRETQQQLQEQLKRQNEEKLLEEKRQREQEMQNKVQQQQLLGVLNAASVPTITVYQRPQEFQPHASPIHTTPVFNIVNQQANFIFVPHHYVLQHNCNSTATTSTPQALWNGFGFVQQPTPPIQYTNTSNVFAHPLTTWPVKNDIATQLNNVPNMTTFAVNDASRSGTTSRPEYTSSQVGYPFNSDNTIASQTGHLNGSESAQNQHNINTNCAVVVPVKTEIEKLQLVNNTWKKRYMDLLQLQKEGRDAETIKKN